MKAAGIIAEYDPFHAGHAWQIMQARAEGAQVIAVCMSGDLVQRGSAALLPPWVRAAAAVDCGADLVLELPNPWACLSAEGFAAAGVALLSALGDLDTLVFGAEQADLDGLMQTARVLLDAGFSEQLNEFLSGGMSFAAARAAAAEALCPGSGMLLARPNNNLGIEYCKAILRQHSHLTPFAIHRKGADHGQEGPGQQGFASASHLRNCWQQGGAAALEGFVPDVALKRYQREREQAIDRRLWDVAMLSRLRGMSVEQLARTRGTGEGLENLLANGVRQAGTLEALYDGMKSKRYAHARLRRYVMDAALGYTDELPELPPYLHVLAATPKGLDLLRSGSLPADTSLARLTRRNPDCAAAAEAHLRGADLAALCRKQPQPMGQSYTRPPYLKK